MLCICKLPKIFLIWFLFLNSIVGTHVGITNHTIRLIKDEKKDCISVFLKTSKGVNQSASASSGIKILQHKDAVSSLEKLIRTSIKIDEINTVGDWTFEVTFNELDKNLEHCVLVYDNTYMRVKADEEGVDTDSIAEIKRILNDVFKIRTFVS